MARPRKITASKTLSDDKGKPRAGCTATVVMLQCMAGMFESLEVGDAVAVPPDVAKAWAEAGIATVAAAPESAEE